MVRTVIYNASVLALDEDDTFHYPGTVEFEDDRISKIYGGSPSVDNPSTDVIWVDGTDKLIMPGLIDLHFHTSIAKVSVPYDHFKPTRLTLRRDMATDCHYGNF